MKVRISTDKKENLFRFLYPDGSVGWTALLSGVKGGYEFSFSNWSNMRNNSGIYHSTEGNILQTSIEKIILNLDPETEYEERIMDNVKTRFRQ